MTKISDRLQAVILRSLELENTDIYMTTTADEVPGWDSLRHLMVIVAIEEEYGIRLPSREVRRLNNIGELQQLVDTKLGEK